MKRSTLAMTMGLLCLAPALAAEPAEQAPLAPAVSVLTAVPMELVDTRLVTGTLVPREEVLVVPEVEGLRIAEILAEEGDQVKAGQVLARLSRDQINTQMDQWQAVLNVSKAQIAQARNLIVQAQASLAQSGPAFVRAQELLKMNAGTQALVEQRSTEQRINLAKLTGANDGLALALADAASKDAQWRELQVKLERTTIKAPVDGQISRRSAKIGAIASAQGEAMFRITARSEIELEADVPELGLARLAPGQKASVAITPDLSITGVVRLVSTEVDRASRLGKVRIALPADPHVRIGSFARAIIEISRHIAIALPASALQYDGAQPYAQVVSDGHIQARKVVPGINVQGMIEIRQGLSDGEAVVARAGAFLRDGDAVTAIPQPEGSRQWP